MRTKSKVVRQNPPADFEEVKRRFIRQNRELAKNNSTQSLRIRGLELEVSRLLSDNLDLRNQVLHWQNEVYTVQTRATSDAAQKLKEEMRVKIAELAGIVDAIEDAQDAELPEALRGKRPIEGNWRERQPLSEVMRESQMPTITEDKSYPRRTLGADDTRAIRVSDHSSTASPDLGPPPVARFDYEDPVKNISPLMDKVSPPQPVTVGEEDVLPADLTVNLETRRKRKDGQSRLDVRRHSILPQSPPKPDEPQPASAILRTGAKRKLADRDGDKSIKPPSKGDFTFSRKTTSEYGGAIARKSAAEELSADACPSPPKAARKVLGEKSANMSPRKPVSRTEKSGKGDPEKPPPFKSAAGKEPPSGRGRRASSIPLPSPPRGSVADTVEAVPPPPLILTAELDPKTPAALDLFSPTPSEASARPQGRGDTPPPSDLSTLSVTTDGGDTRPSRRARSAVNYAEPSLISKMRRPDKKMVDALTGLQDPRRAMSASASDRKAPDSVSSTSRTVVIKSEPIDDDTNVAVDWKTVPLASAPLSPLHQKSDGVDENPIEQSPTRPAEAEGQLPAPLDDEIPVDSTKQSATSATISALMAGSRKRRQSSQLPFATDMKPDMDAAAKKLEELDLYEFKDSPSPANIEDHTLGAGKAVSKPRAQSRRHSSMAKNENATAVNIKNEVNATVEEGGDGMKTATAARVGTGRVDAAAGERMRRRRSMMI